MKLHSLCSQQISAIQILVFLWWFQVIYCYQPQGVLTSLHPPPREFPLITHFSVFSRVAINVSTHSHQLWLDSDKMVHISCKALPNHIICVLPLSWSFSFLLSISIPFIVSLIPSWQDLSIITPEIRITSAEINPH